jgi:hypothetical protein
MRLLFSNLCVLSLAAGCATMVTAPVELRDPVEVYVAHYPKSLHNTLLFPEDGGVVEFAYGDWRWYALDERSWGKVVKVLIVPTQGALGRRRVQWDGVYLGGLSYMLGSDALHAIKVDRTKADALRDELNAAYDARREDVAHNPRVRFDLVPYDRAYWVGQTCNQVLAGWLRTLGCQLQGTNPIGHYRFEGHAREAIGKH